jgi:hypothetical protein
MSNRSERIHSKLLVIVPEDDLEEVKFAKKARSLAEYYDLDILFLGKVTSFETEPFLRRRLITLAGISSNNILKTQFITYSNSSWIKIISNVYKTGDFILCPKELPHSRISFSRLPMVERIKNQYGDKVITVTGLMVSPKHKKMEQLIIPFLYWAGIIFILTTAFGLEASFGSHTFGWFRVVGEISLVGIEILSLWVWNSITNRG